MTIEVYYLGFPSAEIHQKWKNARRKAKHCRNSGDIAGEAAAKRRYRQISYRHFGYAKPQR